MAEYRYIVLRSSVEQAAWIALTAEQRNQQLAYETSGSGADPGFFQGKKFRVVFGNGFAPGLRKNASYNDTLGGRIDKSNGSIYYEWRGMIRTIHTLPQLDIDRHFGNLAELEAYFVLNDPGGTPSDIITLVDHAGIEHAGYLVGDHVPQPLITTLQGTQAHHFIPLEFHQYEASA